MKTLLVLVGPTASGKTALSVKLAKHFHTSIISADSRQFYKELSIGTAKPTDEELAQAPHYFVGTKHIKEIFSAGDFEKEALERIESLFHETDLVIMTGGSGLYIDAVCKGFDPLPAADPGVREQIIQEYQNKGLLWLQEEIRQKDPEYYTRVDTQNPQRLMRALEMIRTTGKPFSEMRQNEIKPRDFKILTIGLNPNRESLYQRIDERVDEMIAQGLEDEVKQNTEFRNQYALRTVGYSEFFDYFDGKTDRDTAISKIKQHTRNFAKRQLTWFRKNKETLWFEPRNENEIFAALKERGLK